VLKIAGRLLGFGFIGMTLAAMTSAPAQAAPCFSFSDFNLSFCYVECSPPAGKVPYCLTLADGSKVLTVVSFCPTKGYTDSSDPHFSVLTGGCGGTGFSTGTIRDIHLKSGCCPVVITLTASTKCSGHTSCVTYCSFFFPTGPNACNISNTCTTITYTVPNCVTSFPQCAGAAYILANDPGFGGLFSVNGTFTVDTVPEVDVNSGAVPLALLVGGLALAADQRSKKSNRSIAA
jgi:hypothetical protein